MLPFQDLHDLLPHIACPECQMPDSLAAGDASESQGRRWQAMLREHERPRQTLTCRACRREYPVTVDGIPILWSHALEQSFASLDHELNVSDPTEQDVKAANIHVYENIADAYDSEGVHADAVTRSRLLSAYREAARDSRGCHIDVGCGAGNVLEFFADVTTGPQIGMDVSLTGLRAVRRKGFLAVVGDAERLPFHKDTTGLITASSVLHHLFEPGRLIREAFRVLRPGGVFLTDFDPNGRAAQWGWLAMQLYALRRPVYQFLALGRRRVFHRSDRVQAWNAVAEFHNKPGDGFDIEELQGALVEAGFALQRIFAHNCRDASVHQRRLVKPSARHLLVQSFSGRNAFSRRNSDTLLTASVKPPRPVDVKPDGDISPYAKRLVKELFAETSGGRRESSESRLAAMVASVRVTHAG